MVSWGKTSELARAVGRRSARCRRALRHRRRPACRGEPSAQPDWALVATACRSSASSPCSARWRCRGWCCGRCSCRRRSLVGACCCRALPRAIPTNSRAWFARLIAVPGAVGASLGRDGLAFVGAGQSAQPGLLWSWPMVALLWTYAASRTTLLGALPRWRAADLAAHHGPLRDRPTRPRRMSLRSPASPSSTRSMIALAQPARERAHLRAASPMRT